MSSDAQKLANRRYYEKTREARLVAMRERAKARLAERNEYLRQHPEEQEAHREKAVDKYYRGITNQNKRTVEAWLADPDICPTFKAFLRRNVLTVIDTLPRKFFDICLHKLAIAVFSGNNNPPAEVDVRNITDIVSTAQGR
jgi:hypothetical protein